MAFEDTILLSIKRQYTNDEKLAILVKKVKDLEFKVGVLNSENAELHHNNKLENLKSSKKIKQFEDKIIFLEKENRRYKKKSYIYKKVVSLFYYFLSDIMKPSNYLDLINIIHQKRADYMSEYDKSRNLLENFKNK